MIDRAEILAVSTDLSLAADVVEKDYVLGWLLAGIYAHEALAEAWTFKGGTCLKKCYFETYRFSEDLDFTIAEEVHLDVDFLRTSFGDIAGWIYEETGLEIPADQFRFNVYRNHRGGLCCEGRIYYNGPLRRVGSLPRIKLDLTVDEVLVLPAVDRPVGHSYSDLREHGFTARCYAYEELFAEKVRALAERTRPRDLYDVINLFRHGEFRPAASAVLDVLRQKCSFKGIAVPTFATIAHATEELIGDWANMLGHQLPSLPPFETFWSALPEFFTWLESGAAPPVAVAPPMAANEEIFRPAVGALRRQGVAGSSFLEAIRFAASNQMCVDLTYQGSVRRIEPYSLRRTSAGDILLFAVRSDTSESRSYRLDRIQGARVSDRAFSPRFAIELTPLELGAIPPVTRGAGSARGFSVHPPRVSRSLRRIARRPTSKLGPTYVYQCGYCQKKFSRSKLGSRLNAHKTPQGYPCPGRTGYLVDTKY